MDQGTDARDVLENKVFLLQRGYIGIVNRSQKDIDEKKRIEDAVKREQEFFMNHGSYKHMADRMGTKYLQITLNKQLKFHIQERLPGVRAALQKHLMDLNKELFELDSILGKSDKLSQEKYMIKLINMFIEDLRKRIVGQTDEIDLNDVQGGARINSAFYNEIADLLSLDLLPPDNELAHAIVNIHGYRTGLFTPGLAFNAICNKLIENYKVPIVTAVELITCIVTDVVEKSAQLLQRYPRLKNEVVFRVSTRIKEQEEQTKNQCIRHINAEMVFHNVRHPDFIKDRPRSKIRAKEIILTSVEEISEPQTKDICEGNLVLTVKGGIRNSHRDCWCKLSSDYFCWQKKDDTNDKRNMIPFTELRMQPKKSKSDSKNKNDSKPQKFVLFRADGRSIFRDLKQLEFVCTDMADLEKWTDAFNRANVPVTLSKSYSMESLYQVDSISAKNVYTSQATRMILEKGREKVEQIFQDPHMQRQVDELAGMIESYMEIVKKTIQDVTPKYIMLLLVQDTMNYALCDLAGDIIGITKTETLMEVCAEEEKRRKELQSACNAIEEALKVIGNI
ncbi:dynamin-1-like [Limulus polyphemus]|uniref:dynamin GTPase n=1 Tax=Limulus polyphemus TaxID=6850 RepID=A0ABM1T583_LIMPO|nr:dynamin-1-like [Limulus polyphemus]